MNNKKFKRAVLGGTFDRLHKGHKHLIQTALTRAEEVVVGVTNLELVKHKPKAELIESVRIRKLNLSNYINQIGKQDRVKIVIINDFMGPAGDDPKAQVLVVSELTNDEHKIEMINQKRQKNGLNKLELEIANMIWDEENKPISSTRIRRGEINREGKVYKQLITSGLKINNKLRERLETIQGEILNQELVKKWTTDKRPVVIVGDKVTQEFIENKWWFNAAVIDNKTSLKPVAFDYGNNYEKTYQVNNERGGISAEAVAAVLDSLNHNRTLLEVKGEEDLLALAYALLMPLNSLLVYGQRNIGMIGVEIEEQVKEYYARLIQSNF